MEKLVESVDGSCLIDEKLALFFDKDIVKEAIDSSVDKKIKRGVSTMFCSPSFREKLALEIESRNYNVAPPKVCLIPKDDGGFRKVFVNEDIDRVVLSIINNVYYKIYGNLIHEKCVSYQKGIGVRKIISSVTDEIRSMKAKYGQLIGYKIDISKYFDSLPKEELYKAIGELNSGSPIDDIVIGYYSDDIIIDEDGNVQEYYKSIAQGCAISTFLANYCLRDIDSEISSMDVIYYRYSDDILIIGKDFEKAMKRLSEMLKEKGLSINMKKLEEIRQCKWFTFLGFRINNQSVSFSNKSLKIFQSKIKTITKHNKDNEKALKKAVKDVNWFLYTSFLKSKENFGWAEYFFSVVNIEEDIIELDRFIKDRLRGMYTGRTNSGGLGISNSIKYGISKRTGKNVGANMQRVSNDYLASIGYVSMHHLYKLYRIDRDLYRYEVRRMMNGIS